MRLLLLFLALPFVASSQRLKGYNTISIGPEYLISDGEMTYGIHISGNAILGKGSSLGAEISYTKFNGLGGAYVPVSLKFVSVLNKDLTKISPMLVIQPGYGLYNNPSSYQRSEVVQTKGGQTIFTGLGIMFPSKTNSRAFILAGYSMYKLKFGTANETIETLALRFGFTIQ